MAPRPDELAPALAGGTEDTGGPPAEVTIVAHDIGTVRGMERQISNLIVGLRGLGHPVTVLARSCELPAGTGAVFHRVPGPSRPFVIAYPWFMLAASLALRRWRRGVVQATGAIVLSRVDAISVHYLHAVGSNTPSRPTRVFRLHHRLSTVLKRLGERLCYRPGRARAFICVSEGVAEELRAHYPAIAGSVVTIYNGIDTDDFAPGLRPAQASELRARLEIGARSPVVAFVGSEWERKGLEPAIAALALAPEWTLLVAGAGDEERYRRLAESLGVAESVRWLGVTPDVQGVYDLADALVLPSSYETFSLVTFEAAASGLAVLATPVNGVRELIHDGETGMLITREPEVIADRLRQLAADPALGSRLGAAARAAAVSFGRERMIREHHALYQRLAAPRS